MCRGGKEGGRRGVVDTQGCAVEVPTTVGSVTVQRIRRPFASRSGVLGRQWWSLGLNQS